MSQPAAAAKRRCEHCGTPFHASSEAERFCCGGCAYVYRLIHDASLDRYYDLKDATTAPVGSAPAGQEDLAWLERLAAQAPQEGATRTLELSLQGISCVGCVWLVERLFQRQAGARNLEINAQTGSAYLHWEAGAFDLLAFARELRQFGYRLGPPRGEARATSSLDLRLGLTGAFALNTMLFTLPRYLGAGEEFALLGLFELLALLFSTLAVASGGSYFVVRAWQAMRLRTMHIDLPLALGIGGAYAGSLLAYAAEMETALYFDFVALFCFLMLGGRWLQEWTLQRNRQQLLKHDWRTQSLHTPDGGELSIEAVEAGRAYSLPPGGCNPTTARLRSPPAAEFSLASITGEGDAHSYLAGQRVPAGAVYLGSGAVDLTALESWRDSLLARLLGTPAEAQRDRALERVIQIYLLVVLFIAAFGWIAWAALGEGARGAQAALSVLVVSCPCALGVAVPLATEWAIARLRAGAGLYIRSGSLLRRVRRVRRIVFDKTGTLTLETPRLHNPEVLAQLPVQLRAQLRAVTAQSLHPVSRALHDALLREPDRGDGIDLVACEEPGMGLRWTYGDRSYFLGRGDSGQCDLRRDGELLARFEFTDALREQAREEVAHLAAGYEIHLLSGDRPEKVAQMLDQLGLPPDRGLGGLLPEEKAAWVTRHDRGDTLYIGDGLNDSLAFDAAACHGTPLVDQTALEAKADFYFTGRSLSSIRKLLDTASRHGHATQRVFLFATAYNLATVSLALSGHMHPLLAAILMPLSSAATVLIVAASMRGARTE